LRRPGLEQRALVHFANFVRTYRCVDFERMCEWLHVARVHGIHLRDEVEDPAQIVGKIRHVVIVDIDSGESGNRFHFVVTYHDFVSVILLIWKENLSVGSLAEMIPHC
jgi:hypothetical protein